MWSDDDWLKKFSGKTIEEAEAEAMSGETTNTATQEVRAFILKCFSMSLYLFRVLLPFTQLIQDGTVESLCASLCFILDTVLQMRHQWSSPKVPVTFIPYNISLRNLNVPLTHG